MVPVAVVSSVTLLCQRPTAPPVASQPPMQSLHGLTASSTWRPDRRLLACMFCRCACCICATWCSLRCVARFSGSVSSFMGDGFPFAVPERSPAHSLRNAGLDRRPQPPLASPVHPQESHRQAQRALFSSVGGDEPDSPVTPPRGLVPVGDGVAVSANFHRAQAFFQNSMVHLWRQWFRVLQLAATIVVSGTNLSASGNGKAPSWVPDDEASTCRICQRGFTLFTRRRHHVRRLRTWHAHIVYAMLTAHAVGL